MTGDGGEYLRAEDLRELGDDSLPGQYLDGMTYLSHNLDRYIKVPLIRCLHEFILFAISAPNRVTGLMTGLSVCITDNM